jgi:hypothetical protein
VLVLFTPPLALAVSIAALFFDERKGYGLAGLLISGLTCAAWLALVVMVALH